MKCSCHSTRDDSSHPPSSAALKADEFVQQQHPQKIMSVRPPIWGHGHTRTVFRSRTMCKEEVVKKSIQAQDCEPTTQYEEVSIDICKAEDSNSRDCVIQCDSSDLRPSTDGVQVSERKIALNESKSESCECNLEISTNNSLGMTLIFFSTLCFCIGNAFVNIVGVQIPVLQIVFIRGSSQLSIALIIIAATKRSRCSSLSTWIGASKNRLKLLSRAVWGVAATVLEFAALQVCPSGRGNICALSRPTPQRMPLADVTAINYLTIPFTALLARLLLKEPYRSPQFRLIISNICPMWSI